MYRFLKKEKISKSIDKYEYFCLEDAAYNILNAHCADEISIEIIYALDETPEFVLISTKHQGYIIYNRETATIIEMSFSNLSKYHYLNGKKYYEGPGLYFEKKDGKVNNIITKKEII